MLENAIQILLGVPLLIWGRRLFWLLIGALGFLVGIYFSGLFVPDTINWSPILIALVCGLIGALLGIMIQKAAVWVAGFLAGGYGLVTLVNLFSSNTEGYTLLLFIAGGLIGAALMAIMFESALIVLSSLTGAALIAESLPINSLISILFFFSLLLIGIFIQFKQKKHE